MYQEILVYKESYAESEQNVEGESDVFLLNLSWLLKTLLLVILKIESTKYGESVQGLTLLWSMKEVERK